MGIWFKDEATKRYVMDFLGLDIYSETDARSVNADEVNTLLEETDKLMVRKVISKKSNLWYNIREHNEPSGCEADIWRMCANQDEAKRNHGAKYANTNHK